MLEKSHVTLVALQVAGKSPARPGDCLDALKTKLAADPGAWHTDPEAVEDVRRDIDRAYRDLVRAAAVEPTEDNRFAITPRGKALLEDHPRGIDDSVLEKFSAYRSAIADPPPAVTGEAGTVDEPKPAYMQGLAAYRQGIALSENPHAPDTASHQEWEDGWSDGSEGTSVTGPED